MSASNGHRRNGSIDPFSEPAVYYASEANRSRQAKDRRRAFSSVSRNGNSDSQICRQLSISFAPPNRT